MGRCPANLGEGFVPLVHFVALSQSAWEMINLFPIRLDAAHLLFMHRGGFAAVRSANGPLRSAFVLDCALMSSHS